MNLDFYIGTKYTMLWLESFIKTGEIKDEKEAESVVVRIGLISIPLIMAGVVVSGLLSDRI